MLQTFLKKLADDAVKNDKKITLDDLIKSAVLDNKDLDDAVRELRKAINKNEMDPNHFDTKVLMLTHRNEMKDIVEEELREKFNEHALKLVGQVNDIYRKETGRDLTSTQQQNLKAEIENSSEVKQQVKNEVENKPKLMTPFDQHKQSFKLQPH